MKENYGKVSLCYVIDWVSAQALFRQVSKSYGTIFCILALCSIAAEEETQENSFCNSDTNATSWGGVLGELFDNR